MTRWASPAERKESPLVRWASPTARLLAGALLVVALATAHPTNATLAAGAFVCTSAIALARPDPSWLLRVGGFAGLAIAAVLVPVFATGDVERATRLMARALSVLTTALAFGSAQRAHELGGALRGLGVPASFATVVATMVRQASSLGSEGRRLVLARQLRGARGFAVGPDVLARLFVQSHAKAERTTLAVELRGARAGCPRPIRMRASDGVPIAVAAGVGTLIHVISGAGW